MLTIDAHIHLNEAGFWPPAYFQFWADKTRAKNPDNTPESLEAGIVDQDGKRMLEHMDQARIDHAVILTLDWDLGIGDDSLVPIEKVHERYGEIHRSSGGRLIPFAGIDPRRPDAMERLVAARETGAAFGLKVYPPVGFYPHDRIGFPLYEACQEWGIPLVFHTGSTVGQLRPRFANPLGIQDVQQTFQDLTIWIGHAGADFWWDEAVAVTRNGIDTLLELSGWQRLVDKDEGEFVRRLAQVINDLGAEKILFGSDHFAGSSFRAVDHLVDWIDWFRNLDLTAAKYGCKITGDDIEKMLGGNAARCLGLEPGA